MLQIIENYWCGYYKQNTQERGAMEGDSKGDSTNTSNIFMITIIV
jgi:hypothetical protein